MRAIAVHTEYIHRGRHAATTAAIRWFFLAAGVYGLLAVLPLYLPMANGVSGQGLLYRYGFAGAAAATELMYLVIASDVRRFRALMPVGVFSKLSFAVPAAILAARGEVGRSMLPLAAIDLALGAGFLVAWLALRVSPPPRSP